MDLFKEYDGKTIDLDDLSIYPEEWKNMNVHDLFLKCMRTAGFSLFYMDYFHASTDWEKQRNRVNKLCEELIYIQKYLKYNDEKYQIALLKWLYCFEDEVENQC